MDTISEDHLVCFPFMHSQKKHKSQAAGIRQGVNADVFAHHKTGVPRYHARSSPMTHGDTDISHFHEEPRHFGKGVTSTSFGK